MRGPLTSDFPGWGKIDTSQGVERQRVRVDDLIERRRRYLVMWQGAKSERSRQWSKWQELADYVMPELGRFLTSDHNTPKNTGKILNNTPTRTARSLTAGLLAAHTSPARPWLNLTVVDPELAEWGPMKRWLFEVNRRVRLIYELSNFYRAMAMGVYPGLAVFGLGTCIAEPDEKRVMRYAPLAMGTYAIAGDGQGKVNRLQYEEAWTVAELVNEFGWESVSDSVKVAYNGGWYEQYVAVLRTIAPNEEFIPGTIGRKGKRYGSAWMEIGGLASAAGALSQPSSDPAIGFLRDGGTEKFNVLCARWTTTSRDIYPTGPGHDALDDTRGLMQLERRKLLAISKGVNPAMLIPDALRLNKLSMLPGDAVYYPTGTQGIEIKPAHVVDPRWVEETRAEIQAYMQRIGQAFFSDLMLLFTDERPGRGKQPDTAQEITAKQQEKMLMLGPVVENLNDFLTDSVELTIDAMSKRRMFPPAPREARNFKLKIEFISPLAQAQKLLGVQAKERAVQFIGQMAQLDPKVLVKLDARKMVDRYWDDLGVPPDTLRDDAEVAQIDAQNAKQAQMQQQAQSMLTAADAAKSLGGVKLNEDNVVSRMLGQPAGTLAGEQAA